MEMTLDMVSAGATSPGNPHLTSHYQNIRGGMFIMAKGGCLLLILEGGGRRCSTTNHSRLLYDCKKSSGAGCKTFTSGTWEMRLCKRRHSAYRGTSTTLVNKAQNAQIQVNSHVVFTVHCHCLHDSGENPHRTQHRGRTGPRRALQTLHAKPIVCLCYLSLSFVLVLAFSFPLGVKGKRI